MIFLIIITTTLINLMTPRILTDVMPTMLTIKEATTTIESNLLAGSSKYIIFDEKVLRDISTMKITKKYLSIYYNIASGTNSAPSSKI